MKYRICWELPNGEEDSIIVSGDTVEEIRQKSEAEIALRGGRNPWSVQVEE